MGGYFLPLCWPAVLTRLISVVSGREYVDPIPVGRGDVASAPSDLACTTGKDTGYYSRLNVRASGAPFDIRLPIRVIANLKEGAVEAICGAAVWSKSSGKVRVFLSTTGGKWSISDSIIPLATSTTVLSGPDFCANCDFCVKSWVRGICMWRILWFW